MKVKSLLDKQNLKYFADSTTAYKKYRRKFFRLKRNDTGWNLNLWKD